jgi:hypothetical protein
MNNGEKRVIPNRRSNAVQLFHHSFVAVPFLGEFLFDTSVEKSS